MRGKPRGHRPRLGLVMYYPGGCGDDMGPTAIQPGSQYLVDKDEAEWPELRLTCGAGTVVITHYDLYHRATENTSTDRPRYMIKFMVWVRFVAAFRHFNVQNLSHFQRIHASDFR